jgi:hypothetical protein
MALNTWYRGIRFTKDFLVNYFNYIFYAAEKGSILFTDGTKKIEFSRRPEAIKRASWDYRNLPAVLIGKATGGLKYVTFAKDRLKYVEQLVESDTKVNQYVFYGGDFDFNVSLSVRATTIEERDNLVDIVSIYLAHPDAKDYFMRHYLVLPEAPKLGAESEIHETKIDYPIYAFDMSIRLMTRWQEVRVSQSDSLENIIADVQAFVPDLTTPHREILDGS